MGSHSKKGGISRNCPSFSHLYELYSQKYQSQRREGDLCQFPHKLLHHISVLTLNTRFGSVTKQQWEGKQGRDVLSTKAVCSQRIRLKPITFLSAYRLFTAAFQTSQTMLNKINVSKYVWVAHQKTSGYWIVSVHMKVWLRILMQKTTVSTLIRTHTIIIIALVKVWIHVRIIKNLDGFMFDRIK